MSDQPQKRVIIPDDKEFFGHDGKPYIPDPGLIAAANASIVLGRPLLLTGEPGCGKTDFAHAVANYLGRELLTCQVRSDSTAKDLLYHYDALHRFGDAHMDKDSQRRAKDARRYVELRPLGLGLVAPQQEVVLIDEIDKAPRDLPNDLLHELDRGTFEIKELREEYPEDKDEDEQKELYTRWGQPLKRTMGQLRSKGVRPKHVPIVIITSNVERQLPDAFLRRCIFFHITFPSRKELATILTKRFDGLPYIDEIVGLFLALRATPRLIKKPTTSELIDWAATLNALYDPKAKGLLGPAYKKLEWDKAEEVPTLPKAKDEWPKLPALHCLLKLREDLATVGLGRA